MPAQDRITAPSAAHAHHPFNHSHAPPAQPTHLRADPELDRALLDRRRVDVRYVRHEVDLQQVIHRDVPRVRVVKHGQRSLVRGGELAARVRERVRRVVATGGRARAADATGAWMVEGGAESGGTGEGRVHR